MIKKFSKTLLLLLLIFFVSTSSIVCLADETENTTTTAETTEDEADTTTEDTTTDEEIDTHEGDLYLSGNTIVMDKYVDGNAFIFGKDVTITGQINGNLFVFANNVSFDSSSIIRYSAFVCANNVYYNGACGTSYDYGNLYVLANKFEATFDSYVTGNIKAIALDIILKSAVGKDVDLICSNLELGSGSDVPIIYGDLRYTADEEVTIPNGTLATGTATYTKLNDINFTSSDTVEDILIGFATSIVTVLALYIILNKLSPKFIEKVSAQKFAITNLLKALGIGLATIVLTVIFAILLAGTSVGVYLALLLILVFTILYIISVPMLTISITNALKPALKIEKKSLFGLVLVLVSVILYGISLIPYVGGLSGSIITSTSIGLIVRAFLPHKELSEEELLAIEENKKQAKENKEKIKQEKDEAKALKKEEKLKIKEAKKSEKLDAKQSNKKDK